MTVPCLLSGRRSWVGTEQAKEAEKLKQEARMKEEKERQEKAAAEAEALRWKP